jgi:hypothetical protein
LLVCVMPGEVIGCLCILTRTYTMGYQQLYSVTSSQRNGINGRTWTRAEITLPGASNCWQQFFTWLKKHLERRERA